MLSAKTLDVICKDTLNTNIYYVSVFDQKAKSLGFSIVGISRKINPGYYFMGTYVYEDNEDNLQKYTAWLLNKNGDIVESVTKDTPEEARDYMDIRAKSIAENLESLTCLLQKLNSITEHSLDEGWEIPSNTTITNANTLLKNIYNYKPYNYWLYPTPESEIIIDAGYNDERIILHIHNDTLIYTYLNCNNILSATETNIKNEVPDHHMKTLLDRIS